MPDAQRTRRLVLTAAARQDIRDVLARSLEEFGYNAQRRYSALLTQALRDLEADPLRPGSTLRPEVGSLARSYHVDFSRRRVQGRRVTAPSHIILYFTSATELRIVRILHHSRELSKHLILD